MTTRVTTTTTRTTTSAYGVLVALFAAAAFVGGCPSGDPDSGGGSTGDPIPPPELPGVRVNCCYYLEIGGEAPVVCTTDLTSPCVDPSDPELDTDGNGSLNQQEINALCGDKCPLGLPGDYPFTPEAQFYDYDTEAGYNAMGSEACTVAGTYSAVSLDAASCTPTPGPLEPWDDVAPPSHEGSFAVGPGNTANVTVNGNLVAVSYEGDYSFALYDCVTSGRLRTCYLDLRTLNFTMLGNPVFGDYEVDGAVLDLAATQTTTATFSCTLGSCFGTFEFSSKIGNPISMNFSWDQTTTPTGSIGGGSLLLSNGPNGLGGLNKLRGELDLDGIMSQGTLRLYGSGSDNFGGDFASASFDLTGPVGRYNP